MEFKKERNFIVAYEDGVKVGAWNITTGEFYGKREKPVKTTPSCFTYNNLPDNWQFRRNNEENSLYGYAVRCFREWFYDYHDYTNALGNRFEQLISVGLLPYSRGALNSDTKLTKNLVNYLKVNNNKFYDEYVATTFLLESQYNDFLKDKPNEIKVIFRECISSVPYEYLKTMILRIEHEHVYPYMKDYNLITMIKRYYNVSMALYNKVEVKPNILTNYAILLYLEEQNKQAHYNETLEKYNNKPWLYFQNENFIARPILTKEEFHSEGERQNNCVERLYMERVYNGETHIVVVRRIDNPDKNYITCEVSNDGRIWQYLIERNQRVREQSAIDFKALYQQYINDNKRNS